MRKLFGFWHFSGPAEPPGPDCHLDRPEAVEVSPVALPDDAVGVGRRVPGVEVQPVQVALVAGAVP